MQVQDTCFSKELRVSNTAMRRGGLSEFVIIRVYESVGRNPIPALVQLYGDLISRYDPYDRSVHLNDYRYHVDISYPELNFGTKYYPLIKRRLIDKGIIP